MSREKFILIALFILLLAGCSDDGNDTYSPISDEEQARAAFTKIDNLWTSSLKPSLTIEEQTYTDEILSGPVGGTALVSGSFSESNSSSSSSTSSSKIVDATVTFQQYQADGLKLDGLLRFYYSYRYRMACSSSGCASSTHTYTSYSSEDGNGTANTPITIEFEFNGRQVRDQILLDASREYSTFEIKLTNGKGQVFSFRD